MLKTLTKVFGSKNERELKKIWPMAQKINDLEPEFQKLSDEALKAKTEEFRARLEQGETLDDLAFEAFATVHRQKFTATSISLAISFPSAIRNLNSRPDFTAL